MFLKKKRSLKIGVSPDKSYHLVRAFDILLGQRLSAPPDVWEASTKHSTSPVVKQRRQKSTERRPFRSAFLGLILMLLGIFLMLPGVVISASLIGRALELGLKIPFIYFLFIGGIVSTPGAYLYFVGQRLRLPLLDEVLQKDARPPVLFLRPFFADRASLTDAKKDRLIYKLMLRRHHSVCLYLRFLSGRLVP